MLREGRKFIKWSNNRLSSLSEEKKTELGLSSLHCSEIESGFVQVNSVNRVAFDTSAEFLCMSIECPQQTISRKNMKRNHMI